jgi:hypothetical protein
LIWVYFTFYWLKDVKMSSYDFQAPFNGILQLLLATGYNLPYSVLELLDNSISKKSSLVRVILYADGDGPINRIVICDDGTGMNFEQLCAAFVISGSAKVRDDDDIGKFGVGMKSAVINMGEDITIISKVDGDKPVGLWADIDQMKALNAYSPTALCSVVDDAFLRGHLCGSVIDLYKAQASGTLIQVKKLLPKCALGFAEARDVLRNIMANSYSALPAGCVLSLEHATGEKITITPSNLFSVNADAMLDEPAYETTLMVYAGPQAGDRHRIIERYVNCREMKGSEGGSGKLLKPRFYEYRALCKQEQVHHSHEKIDRLPTTALLGTIQVRVIQVNEAQNTNDDGLFGGALAHDRKGFWFMRGIRCVGFAKHLGKKMHDRLSAGAERQRMLVTFPASLDDDVGSKFNKQMDDKELPSQVLTDALWTIYKEVTNPWTKKWTVIAAEKAAKQKALQEKEEKERAIKQFQEMEAERARARAQKALDEAAAAALKAQEAAAALKAQGEAAVAHVKKGKLSKKAVEEAAKAIAAERLAAERVAAERVAAERVASAERVAAERLASELAAAERLASEHAAAERVASELAAEEAAAERLASQQTAAAAERLASRQAATVTPAQTEKQSVIGHLQGKFPLIAVAAETQVGDRYDTTIINDMVNIFKNGEKQYAIKGRGKSEELIAWLNAVKDDNPNEYNNIVKFLHRLHA